MIAFRKILILSLLWIAAAFPAAAISVLPLSLDDIIDTATVVFHGTCVNNRTERDQGTNFVVTYTTFAVKDVLKGAVQGTHVIKQIGGKMPDGDLGVHVDGVPNFVVGEDYVVFLAGVSAAGFSSPIGLAQGKFTVQKDPAGQKVSNGRDFREMTAGIPSLALPAPVAALRESPAPVRQLGLDDFKQLVRMRAGRAK